MKLRASKAKKLKSGNPTPEDFELVRDLKRCIKSRVRASIKNHGKEILQNSNPRESWKFIKKVTFSESKGSNFLSDIERANNFFANIVKASEPVIESVPIAYASGPSDTEDSFDLVPLDNRASTKLLQHIRTNTSTGPDDIPAFLIRKLANHISPNVTTLFNYSLLNGIYPGEWKKANVIPIYKRKGSKSDVENYRPISVLPILGRILEKAVCRQLQLFCDINTIIPVQQFGFRQHSSCELALLAALDSWMKDVSRGKFVGALLIDLTRAFDSISHHQLVSELSTIGCSQTALNWFSSFLSDRQQRVKLGTVTAPWMPVTRGVPQGSPLSPLLFNIMVRHLPQISQTEAFQFADDLTNAAAGVDLDRLAIKLQNMFSKVYDFCTDKKLEINLSKTQLIIFKPVRTKLPENFGISFNEVSIVPSPSVKLLGVTLDQHFTMGAHIEAVVKKCHGLLGVLRRSSIYLPRELRKLVYTAVIRSQLEYCSSTFGNAAPSHLTKLDVIQKIASRIIMEASPQAHSAPLQLELGLESLNSRRCDRVSSLISDIILGKTHPYFKDFFTTSDTDEPSRVSGVKLDSRRFSVYGRAIYNELSSGNRASNSYVESVLRGHQSAQSSSQSAHLAFPSSSALQSIIPPESPGRTSTA
jgi:hypothetical protein